MDAVATQPKMAEGAALSALCLLLHTPPTACYSYAILGLAAAKVHIILRIMSPNTASHSGERMT